MQARRLSLLCASTLGLWLALLLTGGTDVARAQAPDAPPPTPPSASPPPPPAPGPGFQPDASPLLPAPPPPAPLPAPPPTEPLPAPPPGAQSYPSQAPVYPPPYVPQPYYEQQAPPARSPAHYGHPTSSTRAPGGPGSYEHEGFFLRLNVGVGAGGASYKERLDGTRASRIKTRGLEGTFEAAVGGRIVGNFILHGSLMLVTMGSNKTVDGVEDRTYEDLGTSMFLVGGGGTYYFMPTNLYLTLSLGLGGLIERRDYDEEYREWADEVSSDPGFGTSLSVGKEWWVGRRGEWGIGAAITGAFFTAPVEINGYGSRFRGHSIGLTFSATYN